MMTTRKPKRIGTARTTTLLLLGSDAAYDHLHVALKRKFTKSKTYSDLQISCTDFHGPDLAVLVSYEYTAKNEGNTVSDARRVVHNVFKDTTFGYEVLVVRTGWEAVQ